MATVEFEFNIDDKVKVGKYSGVIWGLAIIRDSRQVSKKRCLVRFGGAQRKLEWFDQSKVEHEKLNLKSSRRTLTQPATVQVAVKLADQGELTTSRLIEIIGSPRASISTILRMLKHAGYVESRPNPRDKRIIFHSLTDGGRAWLDNRHAESESIPDAAAKTTDAYGYTKKDDFFDLEEFENFLDEDENDENQTVAGF